MKVLIVNQHVEDVIGGSEIQCDLIASYLTSFGHEVLYAIMRPRKDVYDLTYRAVPVRKPVWKSFLSAIKSFRPDVIYWRFNKHWLLPAAFIAKMRNIPFVFGVSSIPDTRPLGPDRRALGPNPAPRRYLGWMRQRGVSLLNHIGFYLVDAVTVLNEDYAGRLPVKKEAVIRNSMDSKASEFTWNNPYVLWVASLKQSKNPDVYIELATMFPEIDFLMAGPIQNERYTFVLDPAKLPSNVHYMGVVSPETVNGMLRSALCLVHTCDPEGFGNIFIQAWLQSKPTITLYFDPEEIIEREKLGYYAGSFDNLVAYLRKLLDDPGLREEIGRRAHDYASKHFRPERNVEQLEEFLLEVVDRV